MAYNKTTVILITILISGALFGYEEDTPDPIDVPIPDLTPTIVPVIVSTPLYTPVTTTYIDPLIRYDIDNDDTLDEFELKVIETDYHYKRLTKTESDCFISILGYTPVINPMPVINPPVTSPNSIPIRVLPTISTQISIPSDYYNQGTILPTNVGIYEYLEYFDWSLMPNEYGYKQGAFDCSQMSAMLECILENSGYNTMIYSNNNHAWIMVEFKEGWLASECTGCYWVYPNEDVAWSYNPNGGFVYDPDYYTPDYVFESIYDVGNFMNDFAWWLNSDVV